MLFRFKKVDSPRCLYCNVEKETPLHLFHSCLKTKQLWTKLRQYFSQLINIPHRCLHPTQMLYVYSARYTK